MGSIIDDTSPGIAAGRVLQAASMRALGPSGQNPDCDTSF